MKERCSCRAAPGELHEYFCTLELCPFCGEQLAGCGCIRSVLNLSPSEIAAVDEYIDDSVEPLQSIVERWKRALDEKRRIPWKPLPRPKPTKLEKVERVGLRPDAEFLYWLEGTVIYRVRRNSSRDRSEWTKVHEGNFQIEDGYAYALDLDGDIVRFRRASDGEE
jgi:hypothetical protein